MSRYLWIGQSVAASPRGQYFPRGQSTPYAVPEEKYFEQMHKQAMFHLILVIIRKSGYHYKIILFQNATNYAI